MDYAEFCEVMQVEPSPAVERLFSLFDRENKGHIDLREFMIALSNFCGASKEEKLRFAFTVFDEDGNGAITKQELVKILKSNHMAGSDEEVMRKAETIMRQTDKDGDGVISFEEFVVVSKRCAAASAARSCQDAASLRPPRSGTPTSSSRNSPPRPPSPSRGPDRLRPRMYPAAPWRGRLRRRPRTQSRRPCSRVGNQTADSPLFASDTQALRGPLSMYGDGASSAGARQAGSLPRPHEPRGPGAGVPCRDLTRRPCLRQPITTWARWRGARGVQRTRHPRSQKPGRAPERAPRPGGGLLVPPVAPSAALLRPLATGFGTMSRLQTN